MDAYYQQHLCGGGRVNRGAEAKPRGASVHQPADGCCPRPAETRQSGSRADCCSQGRGPNQHGRAEHKEQARGGDFNFQPESEEEELELPLQLRSDDEWENHCPLLPQLHHTHTNCGHQRPVDVSYYLCAGGQGSVGADHVYQPQPWPHCAPCQHNRPWAPSPDCCVSGSVGEGGVSVNVPIFSIPAVDDVLEVSVMSPSSAGAEASVSLSRQKTRSVSLPDESRNIFVTYSSDASAEIVPFIDFLTEHGFRPAVDIFDNTVRPLDVNAWKDSYLNDPSVLIIVAISPKYKADVDGFALDSHGLHTKYIHSMMQNEFIQRGSLNFRFIPVLFLNASQKHVPNWLQNTCVYRWPQDTGSLLLRLLREERYNPPRVPCELALVIKPVAPSSGAALWPL